MCVAPAARARSRSRPNLTRSLQRTQGFGVRPAAYSSSNSRITRSSNSGSRFQTWCASPRSVATARASWTASVEQQLRAPISRSPGHSSSVIANACRPESATRAATRLESTPPDMATATTAPRGSCSSGSSGTTAAGHGGDDGELVALADRRVEALAEADVGVVDVDVDELAKLARVIVEPVAEAGVRGIEILQRVLDRSTFDADLGTPVREPPQGTRDANRDCHRRPSIRRGAGPTVRRPALRCRAKVHDERTARRPRYRAVHQVVEHQLRPRLHAQVAIAHRANCHALALDLVGLADVHDAQRLLDEKDQPQVHPRHRTRVIVDRGDQPRGRRRSAADLLGPLAPQPADHGIATLAIARIDVTADTERVQMVQALLARAPQPSRYQIGVVVRVVHDAVRDDLLERGVVFDVGPGTVLGHRVDCAQQAFQTPRDQSMPGAVGEDGRAGHAEHVLSVACARNPAAWMRGSPAGRDPHPRIIRVPGRLRSPGWLDGRAQSATMSPRCPSFP